MGIDYTEQIKENLANLVIEGAEAKAIMIEAQREYKHINSKIGVLESVIDEHFTDGKELIEFKKELSTLVFKGLSKSEVIKNLDISEDVKELKKTIDEVLGILGENK